MPPPDTRPHLTEPLSPIMFWNAESKKWCDAGNDIFLHPPAEPGEPWIIALRYPADGSPARREIMDDKEAMIAFTTIITRRLLKLQNLSWERLVREPVDAQA